MQKIIPHLWFNNDAEEAVNYYLWVFKKSKIINKTFYWKEWYEIHKMKEWTVMTIEFEIEGVKFVALNGWPIFKFNEAVSFIIDCETQEEVDYYWEKLSSDKEFEQCWWLKDKFWVSWQVVPSVLPRLLHDPDNKKAERVMKEMLKMKKIDIKKLIKVYEED